MHGFIIKWVENFSFICLRLLHQILTSQSDHLPLSHPNISETAHFGLSYLCQMSPHTNLQCHACHTVVQIAKILKQLMPEYQLLFELVNKVLLPRAERRFIAAIPDLYLTEALTTFTPVSLPALMIEHMKKVVTVKDGRHGLAYGFFLYKVFEHFEIKVGKVTMGTRKQTFILGTLEECECMSKKGGVGSGSTISSLTDAQERANEEISRLKTENAILKTEIQNCTMGGEEPGASGPLKKENAQLKAKVEKLKAKVKELTGQVVHDQRAANERIDKLLKMIP